MARNGRNRARLSASEITPLSRATICFHTFSWALPASVPVSPSARVASVPPVARMRICFAWYSQKSRNGFTPRVSPARVTDAPLGSTMLRPSFAASAVFSYFGRSASVELGAMVMSAGGMP